MQIARATLDASPERGAVVVAQRTLQAIRQRPIGAEQYRPMQVTTPTLQEINEGALKRNVQPPRGPPHDGDLTAGAPVQHLPLIQLHGAQIGDGAHQHAMRRRVIAWLDELGDHTQLGGGAGDGPRPN